MKRTIERSLLESGRIVEPRRKTSVPTLAWWKRTAENWSNVELDAEPMGPVREGVARLAAYQSGRSDAHNRATSELAELRRAIARGEVDFVEAAGRYSDLKALQAIADPKVVSTAAATLASDVTTEMRARGDELITEHLAPAFDAVVAEARKLAPAVAGISDESAAMRAADRARTAWGKLTYLAVRRVLLRDLARRLRAEAIVSISPAGAHEAEYEYRHPEVAPAERTDVPGLVALVTSDADPALLTADEVDIIEACRAEPLRVPKQPAPPIVRRDGSLIGGSR